MSRAELPIIAIVGATATGKSEVAVALARTLGGEIVGADSRQVYRGMAIGTAQPTPAQLAAAPHHLIGFLPPDARFSLAEYLDQARSVVAAIRGRGRLPIVAGGTGQYVWALLEGWNVPRVPPDEALRAALDAYAREHGPEALYRRLREADPEAAAFIDPRNVRRVARALEVITATGRPFSAQRGRGPAERAIVIGLRLPYAQLDARIDRRVEEMYRTGFLDEVRALAQAGYGPGLPSMLSIGYPEGWKVLQGEMSVADAIAATQTATRRLARRQGAWFRADDPRIVWIDAEDAVVERTIAAVEQRLADAAEERS